MNNFGLGIMSSASTIPGPQPDTTSYIILDIDLIVETRFQFIFIMSWNKLDEWKLWLVGNEQVQLGTLHTISLKPRWYDVKQFGPLKRIWDYLGQLKNIGN